MKQNDTVDVKKVQNRLLEMAKAIKKIFEENDIKYMITFGTLLGAVRHKGFIPWDDDFDFFLFQEEYEKAIQLLRTHLPDDMFIEDGKSEPLYFHSWAHVKDKKSVAICNHYSQDNIYSNKGISIDLYVTFQIAENELDLYRLREKLAYIERRKKVNTLPNTEFETIRNDLLNKIEIEKKKKNGEKNSKQVLGMVLNERLMYPDEVFPLKNYIFEDTSFLGPNNADAVLKRFFGNYMELPPVDQRITHYDSVVFL